MVFLSLVKMKMAGEFLKGGYQATSHQLFMRSLGTTVTAMPRGSFKMADEL